MIVGITGGIGSGKTWVSSLFSDMGIPVYISDIEAKKLMHTDLNLKQSIIDLFGTEAYENDHLNSAFISEKVFVNKELLKQLNAIVHPKVANHFNMWYKNQKAPFVLKESAILFEIGGEKKCDATILVTAPKKIRIHRVQQRDNISVKAIEQRMSNQWSDVIKIPLTNYVIENIEKKHTMLRVKEVYKILISINKS